MDTPKTTPESTARLRSGASRRRRLFVIAAVAVGLLPLLLLEAGLRLLDWGRPAAQPDPFAGFGRNFPLFERQGAVYRTARAREPFIAPQAFPATKPDRSFRAFCFGGSTVYGHPYLGETAFPKWLELELTGGEPGRPWQVINCGGVSYASYRIVPLVKEALRHQPDLIILATGHNEFLEDRTYHDLKTRSPLWAWLQDQAFGLRLVGLARYWLTGAPPTRPLPGSDATPDEPLGPAVDTRLDHASGYASYHRDAPWHERVVAHYDASVRTIVADCRAAGVPLVLIRLGSNLRDCPPFKSEHRAGLAPEPEADWQAAFDLATAAEKVDSARALNFYREAAAIDGEHPLLNFRIARLLDRLGRASEAAPYFLKAKDGDICPLRIITPVEQRLLRIAAETHTPLVDAGELLAAQCPDRLPGFDWYVDHVHPTIGGHQRIAQALAVELRKLGVLTPSNPWTAEMRRETYARHLAALGPAYFADGERRVGWLDKWAQRQRLAAETNPNDAAGFARAGFRQLDLGQETAAWESIREALQRDPATAKLIHAHARDLLSEGRPERAAALLEHVP